MPTPDSGPMTTPPPPEPSSVRRLLVVEDSPEGRRSLARLLELHGFHVTAAHDGASALAALHKPPPPDAVLTDLFLPDMDGREIAHAARELVPRPYIALITGWDLVHEDAELTELGLDQIFLKPLDIRFIVETLRKALGPGSDLAP